jgi:hypothetical protein
MIDILASSSHRIEYLCRHATRCSVSLSIIASITSKTSWFTDYSIYVCIKQERSSFLIHTLIAKKHASKKFLISRIIEAKVYLQKLKDGPTLIVIG